MLLPYHSLTNKNDTNLKLGEAPQVLVWFLFTFWIFFFEVRSVKSFKLVNIWWLCSAGSLLTAYRLWSYRTFRCSLQMGKLRLKHKEGPRPQSMLPLFLQETFLLRRVGWPLLVPPPLSYHLPGNDTEKRVPTHQVSCSRAQRI